MSTENIMDELETVEEAPEPSGAEQPQKKPRGRPFTPETAKKAQLSATAAKKRRCETRRKMLNALTTQLDLGEELVKALKEKDEMYMGLLMSATKLVGVQYEQSDEARTQNFKVDTKADINAKLQAPSLNITFKDAEPKE